MSTAYCTVVAKHNIALARVTARSFSAFHPEIPFFVLLIDQDDGFLTKESEPFTLVYLSDLVRRGEMHFQYDAQELTFACAPIILGHLLDLGFELCCFVKQESMFFAACSEVIEVCRSHSVTLSTHHLSPVPDTDAERELLTLLAGAYNAGFVGVTNCAEARSFISWWQDRLYENCYRNVAAGLHFDQRWLDLVLSYFPNAGVIRDPGFNVGHWCLPDRDVRLSGGALTIEGQKCSLVRFSGYDYDLPNQVTRYSSRLTVEQLGPAAAFFRSYHLALQTEDYPATRYWPYSHGFFSNGVPIPLIARQIYASMKQVRARFGDPFAAEPVGSFFLWLNGADEVSPSPRVTPLWRAIHSARGDLQCAFPDIDGPDKLDYLRWTASQGLIEHDIASAFLSS